MTTTFHPPYEQGWLGPATSARESGLWRVLRFVGSLRLTLVLLPAVAAAVVWSAASDADTNLALVAAFVAIGVNLAVAVALHPAFRNQPPLLAFHLALLGILVLAGAGRLTFLKGHVELSEGEEFSGQLTDAEAGIWHAWHVRDLRFVQEGFDVDYLPGRTRNHTQARVSYALDDGTRERVIVGDQVPLVLDGYRFYTTFNKGFALTLRWIPHRGPVQRGTIHLPSYPANEFRQANRWTPPGSANELWMQLNFRESLLDPAQRASFRIPSDHTLIVRTGEQRAELRAGDAFPIDGGRFVYEGVTSWMGFKVFYDWTLPWLLASCMVAVLCLAWHFWNRFRARPWLRGEVEGATS